jgi:hypothetical protein
MQTKDELLKRIAQLEFINDQLNSELIFLDELMKKVGFADGLISLKETALDFYKSGQGKKSDDSASKDDHPNAA